MAAPPLAVMVLLLAPGETVPAPGRRSPSTGRSRYTRQICLERRGRNTVISEARDAQAFEAPYYRLAVADGVLRDLSPVRLELDPAPTDPCLPNSTADPLTRQLKTSRNASDS